MTGVAKPLTKERIESKCEKVTESGCWIWMGSTQVRGYGEILSNNKKYLAHRASYETFVGEIPKGMYVCHRCDNVYCVNPNHLFLGTQKDNLQDMAKKGRSTIGSKNPMAKLTEKEVKDIKKALSFDRSDVEIGKQFNVSRQAVQLIKKGKRWNHV